MKRSYLPIVLSEDIAIIPLTKGQRAIIDASDVPLVDGKHWRAAWDPHRKRFYAGRAVINAQGRNSTVTLHRFLLGLTDPKIIVDHINRDPLDNRRSNLRIVTHSQNGCNRSMSHNKTGFKGVGLDKRSGLYRAYITIKRKQYCKWGFKTPEAAFAYRQEVLSKLHGEFYYAG